MFKKYSSIENSYREKEVERIRNSEYYNEKFCVTSKIDGCNFSFIMNKNSIQYAKRSGIINENENFYNWEQVADKYEDNFKKLSNYLFEEYKCDSVQIFGELYGNRVQRRVKYLPENDIVDFVMFDIRLDFDEESDFKSIFIPFIYLEKYSKEFNIPLVPNLYVGKFDECLKYKNDYESVLAKLNGVEKENNIEEGNVIRLYEIEGRIGYDRVILKNKNEKFKEKKNKGIKVKKELTEEQKRFIEEGSKYITESRLHSLFSKGEVQKDWKQFGKISGLYTKDLFEDFEKDNEEVRNLPKVDKKIIRKEIQDLSSKMIRESLKKEI